MAVAGLDEGFKPSGLAETVGDGHSSAERFHGEDVELDPVKIKRIVRKFDMRVLPCLVVMYFMNYLDRQNVAAARLKGLQTDLKLDGLQYSNVINLFFVTYIGCQVPANYLLAFVTKPTWFICTCMVLWGLVSLLTAEAKSYGSILAIRLILGIFEAVFYPGALFTLSKFYTRSELALRSSFFYGAALLASAFGSLFAAGVIAAVGPVLHGIAGWRYLFYIEGGATIAFALIILLILPNFPHNAPFLTPEERLIAVKRLAVDVGVADEDDPNEKWWKPLVEAFSDPVIYLLALTWWLVTAGLAFNSYSPTLTASLGIGGSTISLLLTAPPYIYALIVALVNAWHSDRTRDRSLHVVWPLLLAIGGCIIPLATTNKAARFVGIFLMTGAYGGYPIILGWVQVSFPGRPRRRAAAIGFLAAFANTANLAGGYFFVSSKYGPTYRVSFGIVLAMFAGGVVAALATRFYLIWRNKQLDRAEIEHVQVPNSTILDHTAKIEGKSPAEAAALAQGFRYYI